MGLLSQLTGGAINDDGPIIPGVNNPTQGGGGGGGGWDPFSGAIIPGVNNPFQGGQIIPGVDNPFQSADKAWLPGVGQLNPLNSQSAVGQAVKDIGQLNPFNPDSTAGKVATSIGKDISDDPAKWVAYAVAIAAGQPQLIPAINSAAKLTKKNSSPEEWLTEGVKVYAIQAGGDWLANQVGGLGPQTDITTGETFAGTGVKGATDSALAGKVAGNVARGMFATAANTGTTNINGAQVITNVLTNEGLNQAMAQIPGFDKLSANEQNMAANALKVAINKDKSAAYYLFNQGFTGGLADLTQKALDSGYKSLQDQININNEVYAKGTAEDRELLNKAEEGYKTAVATGDQEAITHAQNKLDILPDDIRARANGWGSFGDMSRAIHSGIQDPTTWKEFKEVGATNLDDYTQKKAFQYGDVFGTGEQATLYSDGRVKDSNDPAPRAPTAAEARFIKSTYESAGWGPAPKIVLDALPKETTVVDDLTKAGLHDDLDTTDLTKVVGGTDTTTTEPDQRLTQAVNKGKAGDIFGQINLQREIVGLPPYASLDEFYASDEGKRYLANREDTATGTDTTTGTTGTDTLTGGTGTDTTAKPDQRLSEAIEKGKSGDLLGQINQLREIVGYAPFATLDEYYASKNAEDRADTATGTTGTDTLTGGTGADTVAGGDPFAYYDPESKQYKYGANHGDFDPFHFGLTEQQFLSSSDPWAVYDPDTGQYQYSIGDPNFDPYKYNLVDNDPTNDYKYRLPNLPGGKTPVFKQRPKTTTTTTGTNTTTTTNTAANTAAPTAPNMALFALLASLGNQQAPAPAPVVDSTPSEPFDFTSEFEVNPYAKRRSASKMAQGGSIDELLEILKRN